MISKNITQKITRIAFSFLFVFLVSFFVLPTDDTLAVCPDGSIDGVEQCDPPDFGGDDCDSVVGGTDGGTLACDGACNFDTSCCVAVACKKDPTVTITPNAPSHAIGDIETYTITVFNNDDNVCGVCLPRNFNLAMSINPSGAVDGDGDPALIFETSFGSNPLNVAAQNNNSTTFDVKSDEGWGLGNYTFEITVSEGSNSVIESEIYNIGAIDVEICNNAPIDDDGDGDIDCDDDYCLSDPFCCGDGSVDGLEACDTNLPISCADPTPVCLNDCTACVAELPGCVVGTGNCDGNPANGCETDLFTSNGNCGTCGNICKAGYCEAGVCPSLPEGGIVPCDRLVDDTSTPWIELQPCKICHLVILAYEIINFLMKIVALITVLAMIIAGLIHVKAGGDAGLVLAAKQGMNKILLGFVVVFISWVIVNVAMILFGYNDPSGDGDWAKFSCDLGTFVYCGDGIVQDPNDLGEMEECEASETLADYAARFGLDPALDSTIALWAGDVSRCNGSCIIACKNDPLAAKIGQGCFLASNPCQKGRYACDMEGGGVSCLDIYGDVKYASNPWYLGSPLFDYCCESMSWDLSDGDFMVSPSLTPFTVERATWFPFHCEDVCAAVGKVCVGVGLTNPVTSSCIYVIHDNGNNCNLPGNNAATNCSATFSRRNPCDCTSGGSCFGVRETACYCAF